MTHKKRILMIGMGGTIAQAPDAQGTLHPAQNVEELFAFVPEVRPLADFDLVELCNIDSTNVHPSHWTALIEKIEQAMHGGMYDGIVVTHGTDTMAWTATAVALAFGVHLPIPIVFTGSQRPLSEAGSDARMNLPNAVRTLVAASEKHIAEVMIVFSDQILRASRTVKTNELRFAAFHSPAFPALGIIDANGITFSPAARCVFNAQKPAQVHKHFNSGIIGIDVSPGLSPALFDSIVKHPDCHGIILKSFGAGNVPNAGPYALIEHIRHTVQDRKKPVIIASKFLDGVVRMDMYEMGPEARAAGAVSAEDMTDVASQVKLMWAMALPTYTLETIKEIMMTDVAGEISTPDVLNEPTLKAMWWHAISAR